MKDLKKITTGYISLSFKNYNFKGYDANGDVLLKGTKGGNYSLRHHEDRGVFDSLAKARSQDELSRSRINNAKSKENRFYDKEKER